MCCNFDLLFHLVFDVVPPRSSVILNEKGEAVARTMHKDGSKEITDNLIYGELKPFNEGSTLILTCDVMGGKLMFIYRFNIFISIKLAYHLKLINSFFSVLASPKSRVSWWVNGEMIDESYEEIAPGKSRNTMKVKNMAIYYINFWI